MSNLLTTSAMIAECQRRVPIGLSNAFWMRKLNEAFRDISQKGAFVWNERTTEVLVAAGTAEFDIPATADPGKPMFLAGPRGGSGVHGLTFMDSLVPRVEWEEAQNQQQSEMAVERGVFSAWALMMTLSGTNLVYKGYLFPSTVSSVPVDTLSFNLSYHVGPASTEIPESGSGYFPTPNCFDGFFIDFAEAEARRIYGLAGWEIIQKKAEAAILPMLDSYRSQKHSPIGLVDQQKQTTERQMMKQERA